MPYFVWLLGIVGLQQVLASPCYTAVTSSKAYNRIHGPVPVKDQQECALACSCATGHVNDDCSIFGSTLPAMGCLAYSYDADTRQCALLGQPRPNMCAEPVIIYEAGMCPIETLTSSEEPLTTAQPATTTEPATTLQEDPSGSLMKSVKYGSYVDVYDLNNVVLVPKPGRSRWEMEMVQEKIAIRTIVGKEVMYLSPSAEESADVRVTKERYEWEVENESLGIWSFKARGGLWMTARSDGLLETVSTSIRQSPQQFEMVES